MPNTPDTTLEDFREKIRSTEITCKECGWRGHSMPGHLRAAHKTSPGQYLKTHPGAPLASTTALELLRRIPRAATSQTTAEAYMKEVAKGPGAEWDEPLRRLGELTAQKLPTTATIPALDPHFTMPETTRQIAYGIQHRMNTFIEGPTGCGKTEWVNQIFARMRRPIRRKNMHGDVTQANFVGMTKAAPGKGTYFDHGILPLCMREGTPLLLDEVDFTPPHIGAVLHPVLEGERTIYLPDTGETITAEPGFMVIATTNTGGKGDLRGAYTGTEVMNTAFLDRFPIKLKATYLNPADEQRMLRRRFPSAGPTDQQLNRLVATATEIRAAFQQGSLSITLSTRKLIDYCKLQGAFGEETAIQMTLTNWLDENDQALVKEILRRTWPGITGA